MISYATPRVPADLGLGEVPPRWDLARLRTLHKAPAWFKLTYLAPVMQAALVLSIWLLNRFYRGIVHDSRIYVGRALADLDPHGLGREPAFLLDQQTNHSVFSHLLTPLVARIGPSETTMAVTLAVLLIWLAAAAWLARQLTPDRERGSAWLLSAPLICAAILPAYYGPFEIFSFGEALATPRGFAEAAVMAGLAALLAERRWVCGALLVVAVLFHPAMAAPGLGVMFLVLAQRHRRWWMLAPVGLAAILALGALHLGPFKTLFTRYDPRWLQIMHLRNGFLFLRDWPPAAWCSAALPAATLAIAYGILQGPVRVVIRAAMIGAVASLGASFVFGDLLGSLLVTQLQLWRALWIVQVLAVLLFPLVAVRLWTTRRRDARLSVILLALSWLELNGAVIDLAALAGALACAALALRGGADKVSPMVLKAIASGAVAVIVSVNAVAVYFEVSLIGIFAHAGLSPPLYLLLAMKPHAPRNLVFAATFAPLVFPALIKPPWGRWALPLAAAVLAPLALFAWDERTPVRRMIDLGQGRSELNRLIGPDTLGPGAPSGVVWVPDDAAPWFLLSRASWTSDLQGSIGAFSRPLSLGWDRRAAQLVASGLGTIRSRNPWDQAPEPRGPTRQQSVDGALRLCATTDGPQAVVLAGDLTRSFPRNVAAAWRAPVTTAMLAPGARVFKVVPFDAYTVVRCARADVAPMQRNLTSAP